MLKWLKQKPSVHLDSPYRSRHQESIATTDDPLATFQVQLKLPKVEGARKKGKLFRAQEKKKNSEVYSVSRVNPLFQDQNNSIIIVNPGKNGDEGDADPVPHSGSGSSGYDSHSNTTNSINHSASDNEEDATSSASQNEEHSSNEEPVTLFKDTDSDLLIKRKIVTISHTSNENDTESEVNNKNVPVHPAITEPEPHSTRPPIIVHQNPGYVKSIILALGGGGPHPFNSGTSDNDHNNNNTPTAIGRLLSSTPPPKINKHMSTNQTTQFGGPPPPPPAPPVPSTSASAKNIRANANALPIPVPVRKISSTSASDGDLGVGALKIVQKNPEFVHSVQICSHPQGPSQDDSRDSVNSTPLGTMNVGFGKPARIVQTHAHVNVNRSDSTDESSGLDSAVGHPAAKRKPSVTFSELVDVVVEGEPGKKRKKSKGQNHGEGLQKLSTSLGKQRMVKQIISKNTLPPPPDDLDIVSIAETDFVYHAYRNRGTSTTSSKSPFGGIADHYAAAKEIAKEIDSYAVGTTKSRKISFVRDLLLSHGNRSKSSRARRVSPPAPIATTSSYLVTPHNYNFSSNSNYKSTKADFDSEMYPIIQVVDGRVSVVAQSSKSHSKSHLNSSCVYVKVDNEIVKTGCDRNEYDYANQLNQGQDHTQTQVPIYEALPGATSANAINPHEDSDSGNSTDRNRSGSDSGGQKDHTGSSSSSSRDQDPGGGGGDSGGGSSASSVVSDESGKNKSKVMIISGDQQNMVVDLTRVPTELRTAIIAGTTLMKLPNNQLEAPPGYTLITIPQELRDQVNGKGKGEEDEEGVLRSPRLARNNLTQMWQTLQGNLMGEGARNKKGTTTGLPFHPNKDAHTTADFTLEGHRLALQAKRVRNGKRRRCLCRLCGVAVFLVSFLGVIVTLSLIYTNGRKYFGSA